MFGDLPLPPPEMLAQAVPLNKPAKYREKFFTVLMFKDGVPVQSSLVDSYSDAMTAAKHFDPPPDAFKIEKLYVRDEGG